MDTFEEVVYVNEDSEARGRAKLYVENYVHAMPKMEE